MGGVSVVYGIENDTKRAVDQDTTSWAHLSGRVKVLIGWFGGWIVGIRVVFEQLITHATIIFTGIVDCCLILICFRIFRPWIRWLVQGRVKGHVVASFGRQFAWISSMQQTIS